MVNGRKTNYQMPIYSPRPTKFVLHHQLQVIRKSFTQDHSSTHSVTTKHE